MSSSCPRRLSRRLPTAKDKDANQGLGISPTRSLGARNNGQNAFLHLSEMTSFTHARLVQGNESALADFVKILELASSLTLWWTALVLRLAMS